MELSDWRIDVSRRCFQISEKKACALELEPAHLQEGSRHECEAKTIV